MTSCRPVRLGDVLEQTRRPVIVDPTRTYHEIGIRSFGRGIFHKPPVSGAELGNKKIFEIRPGDFVLNIVFAWEGALAIATDGDAGRVASHRFPTYEHDPSALDIRYLLAYFHSDAGRHELAKASPGSAGRNRTLNRSAFVDLEIPLPDIDEQRRVADWLDRVTTVVSSSRAALQKEGARVDAVIDTSLSSITADVPHVPLSAVAGVNPRPATRTNLDPELQVSFVPMAAIDDRTGMITRPQVRSLLDIGNGYRQFLEGDLVFARITPCMQNGKTAVATNLTNGIGYGSTEFHVIRASDQINVNWLHHVLRSHSFRRRAKEAFRGSAGQQRVPAQFLREALVPLPSREDQRTMTAYVARLEQHVVELNMRRDRRHAGIQALLPAAINQALA